MLYTLLEGGLTERLEAKCQEFGVPCLSVLGPVLRMLQSYLGAETTPRIGAQHMLNAEYFRRIDALNFTMLHDDGQHTEEFEDADVVLLGVSRTSKTPTSIYLANRGVKTGNYPLVPGVPLPAQPRTTAKAAGGRALCQPGADRADPAEPACSACGRDRADDSYIDRQSVAEEVAFSRRPVRAQQLAQHRRDAPLDRGDGRRRPCAARRTAPAPGNRMSLGRAPQPLVLASGSRIRRQLLENAGIPLEIRPADIDERAVEAAAGIAPPAEIAQALALAKGSVGRGRHAGSYRPGGRSDHGVRIARLP